MSKFSDLHLRTILRNPSIIKILEREYFPREKETQQMQEDKALAY
jgi:hypothetical protein